MYMLVPLLADSISFLLLLLVYKLRSKDLEWMMCANVGDITKEEARAQLSKKYEWLPIYLQEMS